MLGAKRLQGLTVLALTFFAQGKDELGAICFVGSLCFKQMALYYAPAVGSYLLANCVNLGFSNGYVAHLLRTPILTEASSVHSSL